MKYSIVLLLACIVATASAQTTAGFNDWVTSLAIDPSGRLYAGTGSNGDGIFTSTDGGNSWKHSKMNYGVTSVTLAKSGTLVTFANGHSYEKYLFRLKNGGAELDSVTLAFIPTFITASDNGALYATALDGGIYRSTDDGAHWTKLNLAEGAEMVRPVIAVTDDGVILVATQQHVFRSADNGANWTRVFDASRDSATVNQIVLARNGTLYAGAFEGYGVNKYEVFMSADSGKNWTMTARVNVKLETMAVDSAGNVLAANADGVYRITPLGDTSHLGLDGIAVNGLGVRSLLSLGKDTLLAGAWGGVYKTTDAGKTWQLLNEGMTSDSVALLDYTSFVPSGSMISAGVIDKDNHLIVGTDSAGVFRSVDNGRTWVQSNLTLPNITSIVLTDTLGVLYASTLNDGVYISTDNGVSWALTEKTDEFVKGRKFYSLACMTRVIGNPPALVTFNYVYGGSDYGVYCYFNDWRFPIWAIKAGVYGLATKAVTTVGYNAYACTIDGQFFFYDQIVDWFTWHYKGTIGSEATALIADKSGAFFVVGPQGVFRSTDDGVSWVRKNAGIADTNLISIAVDKSGNIFAGSMNNGDIYQSSDQGEKWYKIATLGYPVRSLLISTDGLNMYASAAGRLFKRAITPTAVNRPDALEPNQFSLAQNFPNPFNPSTTISFGIPSRSRVSLKIYDVMGREVATLASEEMAAGKYSRQWNASGMPSGVYFYRLQAGSFAEAKKLLLVR